MQNSTEHCERTEESKLRYSQTNHQKRPPTLRRRVKRWVNRHFAYIFVGLVFLLGILAGAVIACTIQPTASTADKPAVTSSEPRSEAVGKSTTFVDLSDEISVEPTATQSAAESTPAWEPDAADVEMLAKLIWGEARGIPSTTEKAAVVWCVLNRVDSPKYPDTVAEVVTQRHQFVGYKASNPTTEEFMEIARDVLVRWHSEKNGTSEVGRVLPKDYLYFTGDGARNYFTAEWSSSAAEYGWTLPSPYGT